MLDTIERKGAIFKQFDVTGRTPGRMVIMYTQEIATDEYQFEHAPSAYGFDYRHQAWVKDGKYISCGHGNKPACGCYGAIHAGEPIAADAEVE